ncbi:50S ribosome-binding GTPase [Acholeplasma sp. OttesenSCG-928-E16]|nr:50S ribosome-binding GTPase [Acholeplasma sp. OttesenSCG-928-E16]
MSNKCVGCGATLQNTNVNEVGYVEDLSNKYCIDCFKLKNYGVVINNYVPLKIDDIDKNSICLMISSVLHLDLLFSHPVYRYQSEATFIYIINQMDLLPSSTNLDLLLENIEKKAKKEKIPYQDIIFMSALNKQDNNNLRMYLKNYKNKKIFLLGVQNSGKTTIFKELTNDLNALSIIKAGLTQERLEGNFLSNTVYDMPGLYQEGYLHTFLPYEMYKKLIPTKRIKPKIYQVKPNDAIIIENLIGISFIKTLEQTAVFYLNNNLRLHKTNNEKVSSYIAKKEKTFVDEYITKTIKTYQNTRVQITFGDMGFMHLITQATIEIKYPKGMHISITEALFK